MMIRPRRTVAGLLMALLLLAQAAPITRAQSGPLYFPATGHFLTDDQGFLSFWRAHDGERLLGFPIAEASVDAGGAAQYFERGRLEQQIDPASGTGVVRTAAVGTEYAQALWRRFAPAPPRKVAANEQVFASMVSVNPQGQPMPVPRLLLEDDAARAESALGEEIRRAIDARRK